LVPAKKWFEDLIGRIFRAAKIRRQQADQPLTAIFDLLRLAFTPNSPLRRRLENERFRQKRRRQSGAIA
jgi:hypothetical protein